MSKLIVLCGERGVGKDFLTVAVADHMKQYGVTVTRLSFSDEVRRIAYRMFPFLESVPNEKKNDPIVGEPNNPNNLSWREIIKSVGKICRDVDSGYFAKQWRKNQSEMVIDGRDEDVYIITDMRTEDEYQLLLSMRKVFTELTFIKICSETGLPPDDFEEWTRNFKGDIQFINKRNEESVKAFCEFFEPEDKENLYPDYINAPLLCNLLKKQNSNNALYAGRDDWMSVSVFEKYAAAADREFSEFLDEISTDWAWWKKGEQTFDVNKAVVEFCDYICFKMSLFLMKNTTPVEADLYISWFEKSEIYHNGKVVDFSEWYNIIQTRGMKNTKLSSCSTYQDFRCLATEINITIDYLGITLSQLYNTMLQVLERNAERGRKIAEGKIVNKQAEPTIVTVEG